MKPYFAGLKILYAVMRVRVQFPSGALENQRVVKVLAVSKEAAFLFTTTVLQHLGYLLLMLTRSLKTPLAARSVNLYLNIYL